MKKVFQTRFKKNFSRNKRYWLVGQKGPVIQWIGMTHTEAHCCEISEQPGQKEDSTSFQEASRKQRENQD